MTRNLSPTWITERLLSVLRVINIEPYLAAGIELVRRRKVLDFSVSPGTCSIKIQAERFQPVNASLQVPMLNSQQWTDVFAALSQEALFPAMLLSGELPAELNEIFVRAGIDVFPAGTDNYQISCSCAMTSAGCEHIAALYFLVTEKFDENPLLIFTLLGKPQHETIVELRKFRQRLKASTPALKPSAELPSKHTADSPPIELIDSFWSIGTQLWSLRYNIRADELPAAILRHLDAIPVEELNYNIDPLLEDAYEHVANRAQAFGLGLVK